MTPRPTRATLATALVLLTPTPKLARVTAMCVGVLTMLTTTTTAVAQVSATEASSDAVSLKEAAAGDFLVGTAVMASQLDDPRIAALVRREFNVLTAENEMKPDQLQPRKGEFNWSQADKIIAFAEANDMKVIGHTLVWHNQSPRWLFEDEAGNPLPREEALANMRDHIHAVVGRYKGRVHGWDVVNEAISDGGPYLRDTPALRSIGDDYVVKAFEFAREADPEAELYYNDYNIERDYKREKVVRLLQELDAAGVRADAVGIQGHWLVGSPSLEEIERGIRRYIELGYKIEFTELDVDPLPRGAAGADLNARDTETANPYTEGLTDASSTRLAERYADIFELFMRYRDDITRVTFWGVHDGTSWLNGFPVSGRTNHPLLFDRNLERKEAYHAVLDELRSDDGD